MARQVRTIKGVFTSRNENGSGVFIAREFGLIARLRPTGWPRKEMGIWNIPTSPCTIISGQGALE